MDVFALRDHLIHEYQEYVNGYVVLKEPGVKQFVQSYFDEGRLWPEPLVQLNPAFESGRTVDRLVADGVLHPECANIFRRRGKTDSFGDPITLHRHQDEAIAAARSGKSYVLTTGTGSGKSLAYFIPIVDHVLKHGSGRGIKAIVVYPMNALCNSQEQALTSFLKWGYPGGRGPVTFAKYTGQESDERRRAIQMDPPDILLTNFVMLELILTRGEEQPLVDGARGLEFLVLDELHTYRGRQGADVAMLVRRVRERCGAPSLRCVGTSATLAGSGTREERQAEVAAVSSLLFGAEVPVGNVIGETLKRGTEAQEPNATELATALAKDPSYPTDHASLVQHPVAIWAETAFGLRQDEQGRLERRSPRTLSEAAAELSQLTGVPEERCRQHLRALLLAGYGAKHPVTGFPLYAFRLHQFISRGDTVYATPEPPDHRHFSAEGQVYVPGDRGRRLYPLAFCRNCGQDYLVVSQRSGTRITSRELSERSEEEGSVAGFVVVDNGDLLDPLDDYSLLPEDWTELGKGGLKIKSSARHNLPVRIRVSPDGRVLEDGESGGCDAWFLPAPFRFCIGCGITYASGRESDFSRLAELASGGRSTDTTILSMAIVRALRGDTSLPKDARKLLSFTDNRQDASLQAGHFNDFVQVTLLRAAILAAIDRAGEAGLRHDEIAQEVTAALALGFDEYAANPQAMFAARRATDEALRDVVGYRLYHDLRRGWRISAPNLEQVGLLRIGYEALDELCADEPTWQDLQPDLAAATPLERERACKVVLDHMRRSLAIKVKYLDAQLQDQIKQRSYQHLRPPWSFEQEERLHESALLLMPGVHPRSRDDVSLGVRSLVGRYLRRGDTWPSTRERGKRLTEDEYEQLVADLLKALTIGGHVEEVAGYPGAYVLQAGVITWRRGDGTVEHDPIRVMNLPEGEGAVNEYFADLYQVATANLRQLEAREHTAQVPTKVRAEREEAFGEAKLPILYCSPTMELGVDIRDLNAVNMRNVPPTPANYAQRSGRAGRSGQPALVLTYCASTSPHDQYYFRRPEQMVAGAVVPPRLDLANEDLIRAHVHAVWLAETGQSLYSSVSELLDLSDESLPLKEIVRNYVNKPTYQLTAQQRCHRILATLAAELTPARAAWYTPDWLGKTIQNAPLALDRAADRWRHLFRAAQTQQERQHKIVSDPLRSFDDKKVAQRLREEAESQIDLLMRSRSDVFSDFYSYRYFATEGFLPGYNFPRLPVTAYIPGRQKGKGQEEYLSRARFIAISEFGPRSVVYHEGNRYRVSRIVLPREEGGSRTRSAQFCEVCGYGHFGDRLDVDLCDRCGAILNATTSRRFDNLLRLESVSTYQVDRISCDEEERLRLGYEIQTIYRFGTRDDGAPVTREVTFVAPPSGEAEEAILATATYGPATTLWRVNLGWTRRQQENLYGFVLDMERGIWGRSNLEPDSTDVEDPLATPTQSKYARVVPFVEDHRNALVFTPKKAVDLGTLISLQYALKRGIEARYQLEDSELAAECLPTPRVSELADERLRVVKQPRHILFYEASEGGAGVLVRLAEEPSALAEVAREALRVCHFDPDSGADLHSAPNADEECEAACYDCLLSYSNQRIQFLLDRQLVRDILLDLENVTGRAGAGGRTREEQRTALLRLCESDLERDFVNWLYDHGLRLPDRAQGRIDDLAVRPDFVYDGEAQACVYVDGAPHRFADRQVRDEAQNEALARIGWTVIRVQGPETWEEKAGQFAWVFGN